MARQYRKYKYNAIYTQNKHNRVQRKTWDSKYNWNVIASQVVSFSNTKQSCHVLKNNNGGGLDSLVHLNYKEDALSGQISLYDGDVFLGSRGPSKDRTELLLNEVGNWDLREDRQLLPFWLYTVK